MDKQKQLEKIGFALIDDEWVYDEESLRITAKKSGYDWEFDIILPNGYALSMDADRLHILTSKIDDYE